MSADKRLQQTALSYKTAKDLLTLKDSLKQGLQESDLVHPENEIQQKLIAIYKQIIRIENIGITHDFFKIGGNSLKAVYLISSVQKVFNVQLSLIEVFKNPVIKNLAQLISTKDIVLSNDIKPLGKQEYYLASHSQKRIWILDHFDVDHTAYNMPDAFKIDGKLNVGALEKSFIKLIEKNEILRTTFLDVHGDLMQKVNESSSSYKLEFIKLKKEEQSDQLIEKFISHEVTEPFDLINGPLIRTILIQIDEDKYLFILNLHHIISDGWSMNVLVRQLFGLYFDYSNGVDPYVKPHPIQYKDYVNWYDTILNSPLLQSSKEYWNRKFLGHIPKLNLTEKVRPIEKDFIGKTIDFIIEKELTSKLKAYSSSQEATMFMCLQAFVNILISKYSGENDIIIGTPVAGRIHKDLEDQIGLYLNNIVLRNKIVESMNLSQLLQQIKDTTLEAIEHQIYPYDKLIEDLNLKHIEGRNPLYDIMVVMETNELLYNVDEKHQHSIKNLKIENLVIPNPISKLDLTFFFRVEDIIKVSVEYKSNIFEQKQIESMIADFVGLVSSYFNDPGLCIAELKSKLLGIDEIMKQKALESLLIGEFKQDF